MIMRVKVAIVLCFCLMGVLAFVISSSVYDTPDGDHLTSVVPTELQPPAILTQLSINTICINGVQYVQSGYSMAPLFNTNSTVVLCLQ